MGMTNKHPGYIYLVDENCKIRWAAVSFAQTGPELEKEIQEATEGSAKPVDEVQALASCINVLLQRKREADGKTA
jgi:ATPase complex subunit ATP10